MKAKLLRMSCLIVVPALPLLCSQVAMAGGGYDYTFTKRVTWELPADNFASWLQDTKGQYRYFEHAYIVDPCMRPEKTKEENKPPREAQPGQPTGYDKMVPLPRPPPDVTKSAPVEWNARAGTGGIVGPAPARVVGPHAWAQAQSEFWAAPILPDDRTAETKIILHVAGKANECRRGKTYSEASAAGWMTLPKAKVKSAEGSDPNVKGGWVELKGLVGKTSVGAWAGENSDGKNVGQSSDPVSVTFEDTVIGEITTQDIFHVDLTAEAEAIESIVSIDPDTGDWFLSAPDGKAVLEYAFTGDWVTNCFGRASVTDGELTVEGELEGLPWMPAFSPGGLPGWSLAHEYAPSWRAEVIASGVAPDREYIASLNAPFWLAGQDAAIPEPATVALLVTGAFALVPRRVRRQL